MPEPQWSSEIRKVHQGLNEATLIMDAWQNLKRTGNVTDLAKKKFIESTRSGPLLPSEGKDGGMHSSSRDTAFELRVAGRLAAETASPVRFGSEISGGVDLYVGSRGMGVECKRPRSFGAVGKNIKAAAKQIRKDRRCEHGHVAIDTAFLDNPNDGSMSFSEDHPSGRDAAFAGFMCDTMAVDVAKVLAKMEPRYRNQFSSCHIYCHIPALVDNVLSLQSASTVIFNISSGRVAVAVEDGISISLGPAHRVVVVARSRVPRTAGDLVRFLNSL